MYKQIDLAFQELMNGEAPGPSESIRREYVTKLLRWRDDLRVGIDTTKREVASRICVVDAWLGVLPSESEKKNLDDDGVPTNDLRSLFGIEPVESNDGKDGPPHYDYQTLCFDDTPFGNFFLRDDDDEDDGMYYDDEAELLATISSMTAGALAAGPFWTVVTLCEVQMRTPSRHASGDDTNSCPVESFQHVCIELD